MSFLRNALIIVCLSVCFSLAGQTDSSFDGLTGKEILERIRNNGRPATPVSSLEEIKNAIASYAYSSGSGYRDYFSASYLGQLNTIAVVPLIWWGENSDDYTAVSHDLHNIVPANLSVAANRSDYPPGVVNDALYNNSFWKAGFGEIAGMETNLYEPADKLKGDFARIYMYMAAVYPQVVWNSRGAMLFIDGYHPLLTLYGRQILLDWHRADPVDEAELRRDKAIAAAQGNSNPFVSEPSLVEYIWGIYADKEYASGEEPENPEVPTEPDKPVVEPIMLKAVYSISSDKRIDFRSPYVAAGSVWKLDGKTVGSESVSLNEISLGQHEISYSNDRCHGKIIITVKP
ncbi:MAG: endonuclease [Muribaculaceae bacterium]|nr:endonuclease [Muribaculaceae bacterium]